MGSCLNCLLTLTSNNPLYPVLVHSRKGILAQRTCAIYWESFVFGVEDFIYSQISPICNFLIKFGQGITKLFSNLTQT